ncbi:MAG: hypothetical protein ACRDJN_01215, partial [Chloroflexota bacterium]
ARVAAWNGRHADQARATLELLPLPSGVDARAALFATEGTATDLVWTDLTEVSALALQHRLAGLTERVRRDRYDLKRFMPVALQPGFGPDGALYALPEEVTARQVYFNRDHFEAAGIDFRKAGFDFERPAITWEALRRVNLDLAAAPRPAGRLPFSVGHDGAPLELWGWQNGAQWLADGGRRATFDRPEHVEALSWLVAHARELGGGEHSTIADAFPPVARAGDATDDPRRHPFLQSAVSTCFESTRLASTIAGWHAGFPLGYVEPPRRAAGKPLVSWSRSWGYALSTEAPDTAWEVLRFLVSDEAALADAAATAALARVAEAPDPTTSPPRYPGPAAGRPLWYPPFTGQLEIDRRLAETYRIGSKLLDEARDHGLEQLRHARFRLPCPVPHHVWPFLGQARRLALRGTMTPEQALAAAQQEAQVHLDAAWRDAR